MGLRITRKKDHWDSVVAAIPPIRHESFVIQRLDVGVPVPEDVVGHFESALLKRLGQAGLFAGRTASGGQPLHVAADSGEPRQCVVCSHQGRSLLNRCPQCQQPAFFTPAPFADPGDTRLMLSYAVVTCDEPSDLGMLGLAGVRVFAVTYSVKRGEGAVLAEGSSDKNWTASALSTPTLMVGGMKTLASETADDIADLIAAAEQARWQGLPHWESFAISWHRSLKEDETCKRCRKKLEGWDSVMACRNCGKVQWSSFVMSCVVALLCVFGIPIRFLLRTGEPISQVATGTLVGVGVCVLIGLAALWMIHHTLKLSRSVRARAPVGRN